MLVNFSEAKLNPLLIVETTNLCLYSYVECDSLSTEAITHNAVYTGFKSSALAKTNSTCIEYPLLHPQTP